MSVRRGAWIRYGNPVSDEQVAFAVDHYSVAMLQPWETDVARRLKHARPDMTVLVYKCLSSTRDNERGAVVPSGVSFDEALESGEHWFAHRLDGSRIAWQRYDHHWQMATWEPEYQQRWIDNVVDEVIDSPWDGVMADNDVFGDYYGLDCPIEGGRTMADLREACGQLVSGAGKSLNDVNKILVPNIAESRRIPGRWEEHSQYGGGYEEVWMAWGSHPSEHLDPISASLQAAQAASPGLVVLHTVTAGPSDTATARYGLAAYWVFGAGRGSYSATGHDEYSGTPWFDEMSWDLGDELADAEQRGNGWSRHFSHGWAAVNLNDGVRRKVRFTVPDGLVDSSGQPVRGAVTLQPQEGLLLRRL